LAPQTGINLVHENEPATREIFQQFDRLDKALIDASSIIYMDRIDFLEVLASSTKLFNYSTKPEP
jgi:hypothetical protein